MDVSRENQTRPDQNQVEWMSYELSWFKRKSTWVDEGGPKVGEGK